MKKFVLLFMGGLAAFAGRAQWDGNHHREPFIVIIYGYGKHLFGIVLAYYILIKELFYFAWLVVFIFLQLLKR